MAAGTFDRVVKTTFPPCSPTLLQTLTHAHTYLWVYVCGGKKKRKGKEKWRTSNGSVSHEVRFTLPPSILPLLFFISNSQDPSCLLLLYVSSLLPYLGKKRKKVMIASSSRRGRCVCCRKGGEFETSQINSPVFIQALAYTCCGHCSCCFSEVGSTSSSPYPTPSHIPFSSHPSLLQT